MLGLFYHYVFQQLIRKDGDYHSSRLLDGKDIQANQNMQPKKKHKKSSHKVKEKVEVGTVSRLCLLNMCTFGSVTDQFVIVNSIYFHRWTWMMTVPWKSRRTSSVTTATALSGVATTSSGTFSHIQVTTGSPSLHSSVVFVAIRYDTVQ